MTLKIPILLYHSIADHARRPFRRWVVHPELFSDQMAYLQRHRYTPLTVSQLMQLRAGPAARWPERPVLITFDDGFADFYTNVLPVLQRYDLVATLYITAGLVGGTSRWLSPAGEGDRQLLTWSQIEAIESAGVELGAHSQTHPQLDTLSLAAAGEEIRGSKSLLEQHLGHPVETFAYPYGYFSSPVRHLVRQAGYSSACAVKDALSSPADDPFALARLIISGEIGMARFSQRLAGRGLRMAPFPEPLQTKGWRLVRRTAAWLKQHQIGSPDQRQTTMT